MDVAAKFPGITGLFVSGIVSAALRYSIYTYNILQRIALFTIYWRIPIFCAFFYITLKLFSTMSAQINTVSGTIYEDFIVKMMGIKVSDLTASVIMKSIAVISGIVCVILVFVVEKLNGILQVYKF